MFCFVFGRTIWDFPTERLFGISLQKDYWGFPYKRVIWDFHTPSTQDGEENGISEDIIQRTLVLEPMT